MYNNFGEILCINIGDNAYCKKHEKFSIESSLLGDIH